MTDTTITIRLDGELKAAVEKAALAEGLSMTQYVHEALRARVAQQCPACGRSALTAVPPGFAPALETFLTEVRKHGVPIVVTTLENGQSRSYWVLPARGR